MSQFLVGDMCHTWQPNPEAEVSKLVPPLCSARSSVSDVTFSTLRPVSPDFTLQTVVLHHFIRPRALSDGLPGNDGSSHNTHTHNVASFL